MAAARRLADQPGSASLAMLTLHSVLWTAAAIVVYERLRRTRS
jgi:hypothetical protein